MLDRLLIAVALVLLGWGAYHLLNRALLRRRTNAELRLSNFQYGLPAILYFTAPGCMPCRTIQRPALEEISGLFGDELQILKVDAAERPDLANHWGVLSLPTTFIIDRQGRPRGVNHGAVRAHELMRQLEAIGEWPLAGVPRPALAHKESSRGEVS